MPVSQSDSNESCDTIDTRSMCTVQEAVVQEFETEYNSNDISLYLDKDLTDEDRFFLLDNPCQPKNLTFPKCSFGKQNRAFSPAWYVETLPDGTKKSRTWLV